MISLSSWRSIGVVMQFCSRLQQITFAQLYDQFYIQQADPTAEWGKSWTFWWSSINMGLWQGLGGKIWPELKILYSANYLSPPDRKFQATPLSSPLFSGLNFVGWRCWSFSPFLNHTHYAAWISKKTTRISTYDIQFWPYRPNIFLGLLH